MFQSPVKGPHFTLPPAAGQPERFAPGLVHRLQAMHQRLW
jgi:hypothetical protein